MRILIDQDGPLAQFEPKFLELWQAAYPERVFVSLKDRRTFYVHEQYPEECYEDMRAIIRSEAMFKDLEVVPGSQDAIKILKNAGHDLCVCTTPVLRNPWCPTHKTEWLAKYFPGLDIILTEDKTIIPGDILIDDKPVITGTATPGWEQYLFAAPTNQQVTDRKRWTWDELVQALT